MFIKGYKLDWVSNHCNEKHIANHTFFLSIQPTEANGALGSLRVLQEALTNQLSHRDHSTIKLEVGCSAK